METFLQMLRNFEDNIDPQKLYKEAGQIFLLKPFKLRKFSYQKLSLEYIQLTKKYAHEGLQDWRQDWRKNQRKLFIQFLIFYSKFTKSSPEEMTQDQWSQLSLIFFHKNPLFLKFQGICIVKRQDDDSLIMNLTKSQGEGNWNQIAKKIFYFSSCTRFISPKHIRERWYNHLSQQIKRGVWSTQEDLTILEHVLYKNKHWCEIVKLLGSSRTEHMIKNRYKHLLNVQASSRSSKQLKKLKGVIAKIKRKQKHSKSTKKSNSKGSKFKNQIEKQILNQNIIPTSQQARPVEIKLKQTNNQRQENVQDNVHNQLHNQTYLNQQNNFNLPGNQYGLIFQIPCLNYQGFYNPAQANGINLISFQHATQFQINNVQQNNPIQVCSFWPRSNIQHYSFPIIHPLININIGNNVEK